MKAWVREVRDAWRGLKQTPGASIAALVTLAIGLGISFAIFNLLYAALWQPLPYPHSRELIAVSQSFGSRKGFLVSPPEIQALAADNSTLSAIGLYKVGMGVLTGHGPARQISPVHVDAALFQVLGVTPLRGREFTAADATKGAAPVMMLSAPFARKRFGANQALGQALSYDGVPRTIVGIVPEAFSAFLGAGNRAEVLLPLTPSADLGAGMYGAIGRLRPRAAAVAARAEAEAVAARLIQAHPKMMSGMSFSLEGLSASLRALGSTPWLLEGAAALLLLLACVNVSSLLLARVTARRQELAIRQALGARRGQIMRPLLFEGLGLGLAGGFLAWWIAWSLHQVLLASQPPYRWMSATSRSDLAALGFALAASIGIGIVCSLFPAWRAARNLPEPAPQGLGPRRLHGGVIAVEVALALVLAISAALLIRTVEHLQAVNIGFNPEHVLTADVLLPQNQYSAAVSPASQLFFSQLLARARALPGVQSAALASTLPMDGGLYTSAQVRGRRLPSQAAMISRGYFTALGITLLRGRRFGSGDNAAAPKVVIVNQSLAASAWPGQNPIGQVLTMGDKKHAGPWTVVGVVHDTHQAGLLQLPPAFDPRALAYFPRAQYPSTTYSLALRTSGDPAALEAPLRRVVAAMAPEAVYAPKTMNGLLNDSIAQQRFLRLLLELAAALALMLAVIGIYGTINYWVSQRTREVGVRMALGAQRGHVLGLVVGRTLRWAIVGAIIGAGAAYVADHALASILFQVTPSDPASIMAGVVILLLAALCAAWLPARRAAAVDPIEALRHD